MRSSMHQTLPIFAFSPPPPLFSTPRTEIICACWACAQANLSSEIVPVRIDYSFHIPVLGRINCNITSKRLRLESVKHP